MKVRISGIVFAVVFLLCFSHAQIMQPRQTLQGHVRPAVANGQARQLGEMPAAQRMNLSIVLPLRNEEDLKSLLARLYDPSSPDYRHFLSVEEFTQRYGPGADDYQAVVAWAQANGLSVTRTAANRLIVPVSGTVDQVEQAFNVRMNVYQHPTENRTFFSPDRDPSVNLSVAVAGVSGLDNFSIPQPLAVPQQQGPVLDNQVVPTVTGSGPGGLYLASDMRAAYYGATTLDGTGQTVALLEFDGYYPSDVTQTFSTAGQSYNVPINNVLIDGATGAPQTANGEAEVVLDIVQAIGMAPGLSQVRVYMGLEPDDPGILNAIASENIAKQISCSWVWPDDSSLDEPFFEEFAAQGQSFFAASGDWGAYGSVYQTVFYPAEDQYVTAVGGTHVTTGGAGGPWSSETAWSPSGGGPSPDGIPIPSWQTGLANSSNGGSATLRNVPDVAMEADWDNYLCASAYGCTYAWGGTSFAAPRWAAFMAMVNQQAVESGTAPKGGLGFINSSIYALAGGSSYSNDLHDITSGNNDYDNPPIWYNAVAGYDLVTGWGSPTGASLIDDLAGSGFRLSSSISSLQVGSGTSGASTTISITDVGTFTGSVNLAVTSGLPAGVTASWGTNPASGSSVLTVSAASGTPDTNATLTITGTAGQLTASTTVAISVKAPTFLLTATPNAVSISPTSSVTTSILVSPQYGFNGNVALSISGLPKGVTASFSPRSTTGASTLTLTTSSSVTGGVSTLTITGKSGSLNVTTTVTLTVQIPSFQISVGPAIGVWQGTSVLWGLQIQSMDGFAGNVQLSVSGLPSGVTGSFSPNPATSSSTFTLTAAANASLGTVNATITGTSGSLTASTTFSLTVLPPTFAIDNPANVTLTQGGSGQITVSANTVGFSGYVNLSLSGLPAGVTGVFAQNPIYVSNFGIPSTQLTLTAASTAAPGQYTITVTGTSGSLTSSAPFTLSVTVPRSVPAVTVTPSPSSINTSQSLAVTVAVSGGNGNPTPTGYVTLTSGSYTSSPASLTSGSVVITVPAGSLAVGTDTLTATYTPDSNSSSTYTTATGSAIVTVSSAPVIGSVNFGSEPVGSSTTQTLPFTIPAGTTVGSIRVLTQGAPNLDFTQGTGSTCLPMTYSSTTNCTVAVTFAPKYAGMRMGAVVLSDNSGSLIGSDLAYGVGTGAQIAFVPFTTTTLGGGLYGPAGLAVDAAGDVYIAGFSDQSVKEIPAGCFSSACVRSLGGGNFGNPTGVAVDGFGNIYVADWGYLSVSEMPPGCASSSCVTSLGGGGFGDPAGVAVDGAGNIYFTEYFYKDVKKMTPGCTSSACVTTLGGGFNSPSAIAVNTSGNVYVIDSGATIDIKQIPAGCTSSACVTTLGSFSDPSDLAVDAAGNVYVNNNVAGVMEIPVGCTSSSCVVTLGIVPDVFEGMAIDGAGNLYTETASAVVELNLATPPSLSFASTNVGSQSSDSPKTVALSNIGNTQLIFPVPGSGENPSVSANFTLDPSTTCPEILNSGSAGSLAAGARCALAVDFIPQTPGLISGSVTLTDSNLGAHPSTTQSIGLSGAAATPVIPWLEVNSGPWQQTSIVSVSLGSTVNLAGQNISGGSWHWTGPNGFTSTLREIDAVSFPSGTNVYNLTYTNSAGVTSSPQAFTITVNPTAVIPWLVVNNGTWQQTASASVNQGDTVTLAGQNISGGSWHWTGPNGFTSTSRQINAVSLPSGTNIYNLTYTNTAGVISSPLAFTISVNPSPLTPYIQVNGGVWEQASTVAVNIGDTVNLAPTNFNGGSWSWTGPNSFTASTRQINAVRFSAPSNTYTVTYTNTVGVTSSQSFTITVNGTPLTPYIQVNGGSWQQISSVAVNVGDQVNLAPTNVSGGSWSWIGPNGYTASTRQINVVPLNSPNNTYIVTYTNTSGVTSSRTFTVTVNGTTLTPYVQVNGGSWTQANTAAVHVGDMVNLAPLNINGGRWSWTGPNSYAASSRQINAVPLPSPSNTYTVTYTNTSGATSTATFTVTVNGTPLTPYIQVNGGAWQQIGTVAVNMGSTVNLAPTNVSGGSWSWIGPNGYTASTRQINAVPLNSGSNVFTVTYTNAAGVISTQGFTVTINPTSVVPYIQVNGGAWQQTASATVSTAATVNLAGLQQNGGSWSWTGPNGFRSTSREIDAVPLASGTNVYTLTYSNADGVISSGQVFTITVD